MEEQLKVKKWWWENAAELTKSPTNVVNDFTDWIKQAIVVSAMRSPEFNTTDKLISLWKCLSKEKIDKDKIKEKLANIEDFHLSLVEEKYKSNSIWEFHLSLWNEKYRWDRSKLARMIKKSFKELWDNISEYIDNEDKIIPSKENDYLINTSKWNISILWFWEIISADIQSAILNNLKIDWLNSQSVDLKDVIENIDLNGTQDEIFIELSREIANKVKTILSNNEIPVLPGYIPWFEQWIENAIWRWYSDATASMTAVWLSNIYDVVLEIQKSVIWMLSADPRLLEDNSPKLIEKIDYLSAKEITWVRWAQAKLLHPQVLRKELQEVWIKVHLFNPFSSWKWTIISKEKEINSKWVEFIWWRENVTFFTISSWKMSDKWIIADVFSIVKKYTSVDIIWTSETEISFTIDYDLKQDKLDEMASKIRTKLWIKEDWYEDYVKYETNKALIFCVGQNLSKSRWTLWRAAIALWVKWIDIEIVSQWIAQRAMIFGIAWDKMKEAINALHEEFITNLF